MSTITKKKLSISLSMKFELDVYIDGNDDIEQIYDYVEYIFRNKKEDILRHIIDEKKTIRVGHKTNLSYEEDEDHIEILNEDEIISTIDEFEELAELAE